MALSDATDGPEDGGMDLQYSAGLLLPVRVCAQECMLKFTHMCKSPGLEGWEENPEQGKSANFPESSMLVRILRQQFFYASYTTFYGFGVFKLSQIMDIRIWSRGFLSYSLEVFT